MSELPKKTRNIQFDLLRIFAAFMVVMLHTAALEMKYIYPDNTEWIARNIFDSLSRSAVPLFFMLSGAFMLKKEVPLKDIYFKKILPLVLIYIVWSFLYAVDVIGLKKLATVGISEIVSTTVESKYHLWFIPTLIGIYMLHPVLRALVSHKDGAYVKYFIVLFLIFGVVCPTVKLFITDNTLNSLVSKVSVELTKHSGYTVMGYYFANIQKRKYKSWVMFVCFAVVTVISALICQLDALEKAKPIQECILYGNFTLPTFLEGTFLFLGFKNLKLKNSAKMQKAVPYISSLTLGVYLFHPFVLEHIKNDFYFDICAKYPFIAVPCYAIAITVFCLGVTAIMVKIPIVKKLWQN